MSEREKATDQYLELYKLAVEMADRVSARRASLFTFPFTVNTALFALLFSGEFSAPLWFVAVVGMLISVSWWAALKTYRELNVVKFQVIAEMEAKLEAQIYREEYKTMQASRPDRWRDRYIALNLRTVEQAVPIVMAMLYLAIIVRALL